MKNPSDIPIVVHICCFVLGEAYFLLFMRIGPDRIAEYLLFAFFPLIGAPFLFWAIQGESRDYDEHLKEFYSNSVYFMWFIRLFMMVIASVMYCIAAVVVSALLCWTYTLFQKI